MRRLVEAFCEVRKILQGWKVHLLILFGVFVTIVNHFYPLPEWMVGDMKPENWLKDIWFLTVGSAFRAGIGNRGSK